MQKEVISAPMAGITDTVFRRICREYGADATFSEMVSAEGLFHAGQATVELLYFTEKERPYGLQLFGADPEHMAWAASFAYNAVHPDFIDINSGCPVPKVIKRNGGAALLRDPVLFKKIITTVVKAVPIPVTVKIRSGLNTNQWVDQEYARIAEGSGVKAITVHPRSRAMGFSGHSFWERIAIVKNTVSIPVIGNGDIIRGSDAVRMFAETGCDAVMVGRGMNGNPWIFSEIKDAIAGREHSPVSIQEKGAALIKHMAAYRERYGEYKATKEMKKHCSWYLKGMPEASFCRNAVFHAVSYEDLVAVVVKAFNVSSYMEIQLTGT